MSILTTSARFILFGPKLDARLTLGAIIKRKASNLMLGAFGRPPTRGPGFREWLIEQFKLAWAALTGRHPNALPLPEDLPVKLFVTLNDTLRNRGGYANKELGAPNYWISPRNATSTPFFWSFIVDYAPSGDPAKIGSFEMALEDQLTKNGFDYNVRLQTRPVRIEVDKPEPPTVTLAELWPDVVAYKMNIRAAIVGLAYLKGASTPLAITFDGEDFSAFIAASSGGGKTQLAMSIILSLGMTCDPQYLTMIIVDPKAVDFRPFNRLLHLALPVIVEPSDAVDAVQWLVDEMVRRTASAAQGDTSFFKHSIMLYIDEMADLIMSLPSAQAEKLTDNIQRLGQKGRGVGFIVIGATQRVYDVPAAAHSKLNARFVGKMKTAGDSVAASGIAGTTTHKLPGRGSFELYCSDQTGLRIQAPFVAASDKPDYEAKLKPFFDDIESRWKGIKPGWRPPIAEKTPKLEQEDTKPDAQDAAQADDQANTPATDQPGDQVEMLNIDYRIWQRMIDAHKDGKLTGNLVRKLHQEILQRSIDGYKAKAIIDAFIEAQQQVSPSFGD